jgi:hypothetical protein
VVSAKEADSVFLMIQRCGKPSRHLSDEESTKNKNRQSHHYRSFLERIC